MLGHCLYLIPLGKSFLDMLQISSGSCREHTGVHLGLIDTMCQGKCINICIITGACVEMCVYMISFTQVVVGSW